MSPAPARGDHSEDASAGRLRNLHEACAVRREDLRTDFSTPRWLLAALDATQLRDPVKAAAEAAVLASVLAREAQELLAAHGKATPGLAHAARVEGSAA